MSTYFHHLPKELLIIIVSKGTYIEMEGLYFLHAGPLYESFDELGIDINLVEVFKFKYPYLSKLLSREYPDLLNQIEDNHHYLVWIDVINIKDFMEYYSTYGKLPKSIKLDDIIKLLSEKYDPYFYFDRLLIIIKDILNNNIEYQKFILHINNKLERYGINLNKEKLFIFYLFVYLISKYNRYFYNYINDNNFNINILDPYNIYSNEEMIELLNEGYNVYDELEILEYKNLISNKRLFGIIMYIILKDTQAKCINIDWDVLEWYNKNISK
jgi:hypothetical protein